MKKNSLNTRLLAFIYFLTNMYNILLAGFICFFPFIKGHLRTDASSLTSHRGLPLRSCTVEQNIHTTHFGRCIVLLGGSKACSTGTYLDPLKCENLESGDDCEVETTELTYVSGTCTKLGAFELCKIDNMLSFSDDCGHSLR
jgi:hypothetical protein